MKGSGPLLEDAPWEKVVPFEEVDKKLIKEFSCGELEIDEWLHNRCEKDVACGACKAHVCLDKNGLPIAFFTLSATAINSSDVARKVRGGIGGSIPSILLGKMGVACHAKGKGIGTQALHQALLFARESAQYAAARLLVVDALNEGLIGWYQNRGFISLRDRNDRLIVKLSSIEEMLY